MSDLVTEEWSMLDGCLQVAACSHIGLREINEDAYQCVPRVGLVAVADGMGGYEAGEVAARIALRTLESAMDPFEGYATTPEGHLDALWFALNEANTSVFEAARTKPEWRRMGTTLAALRFVTPKVALAHVGDSRVYRLPRDGELKQMTVDHAQQPPLRTNVLTRAIGVLDQVDVDARLEDVQAEDRWLICTDGLTNALVDWEIRVELNTGGAADAARALVSRAIVRARDNVTAVVVVVGPTWS